MPTPSAPVWLITGCSTGLGRALAERVIAHGDRAVVTARDAGSIAGLAEQASDRVLPLALDVNQAEQVADVVRQAHARFGRIDALVNNAGYGYQSTIEEGDDAEIRAQFETNVFALFAITRAVLPIMRAQRGGTIFNITSVAGLVGLPGSGYYAASKHAVEGFSDALRAEVEPLGVRVTCVEPGPFRTDWAGRSLRQTASRIDDYAETAAKRLQGTREASGTQKGDPNRFADELIAITRKPAAPRHLVLGAWGYEMVTERMAQRLDEIRAARELSLSADFATA